MGKQKKTNSSKISLNSTLSNQYKNLGFGPRYVYFSSLLDYPHNSTLYKIGNTAYQYVSSTAKSLLNTTKTDDGSKAIGKITTALEFLRKAAEFERSKELFFFKNFESQFPNTFETFQLSARNKDFNYEQFIIDINKTLKGVDAFYRQLHTEQQRIQRMNEANDWKHSDQAKGLTEQQIEDHMKELLTDYNTKAYAKGQEAFYLQRAGTTTLNGLTNDDTSGEITNLIIKKYGNQLFEKNGDHLKLNTTCLVAIIKLINDEIYARMIDKYQSMKQTADRRIRIEELMDKEIDGFVQGLLNNSSIAAGLTSVAHQHGLYDSAIDQANASATEIDAVTNKIRQWYENTHNIEVESFEHWLESTGFNKTIIDMVKTVNAVKDQPYYTGEDLSLSLMLTNGISAVLGGNANPTDDLEAGKLIISLSLDTSALSSVVKEREQEMTKLQQDYFNQIKKTANLADFEHNTAQLRALRERQNKILQELTIKTQNTKEAAQYLINHMNIHTTVKGYKSAGTYNFKRYEGFEGAAFGSNLDNQLDIITSAAGSSLLGSAGISETDKENLRFAMINAGHFLIGHDFKSTIENYFSIFLSFFMFNDAAIMIEDAVSYDINQNYSNTSQDLHIYQLNNLLLPASYILQMTYENLVPLLTDIQASTNMSSGTKAILHTYDSQPNTHNWDELADKVEASTKLEMKFLAGFLDLVNRLIDRMNNAT